MSLSGTAKVSAAGAILASIWQKKTVSNIGEENFGMEGFQPYLTQAIRQDFGRREVWVTRYHWIGGDLAEYAPASSQHTLSWNIYQMGQTRFLVVAIRLFANLGAPVYRVVIGDLNPSQFQRACILGVTR
jgi:hypothetical protein